MSQHSPSPEELAALQRSYPTLRHFLAAYLHQDWDDEYGDPFEALADLLDDRPLPATALRDELEAVLAAA